LCVNIDSTDILRAHDLLSDLVVINPARRQDAPEAEKSF
jgi:hypothetical protein